MGNPALYWDAGRQSVDLGANGLSSFGGGRIAETGFVDTPASQRTLIRQYDELELGISYISDLTIYRGLKAFEAWALKGNPFAFALDSADRVFTVLDDTPNYIERMVNGNCETWDTASPPRLYGGGVAEGGTGTVRRANENENVAEGRFAVKLTCDGAGATVYQRWPDTISVPAGAACKLTYQAKGNANLTLIVYNTVTAKYLQDDGSWAVGVNTFLSNGSANVVDGDLTMATEFGTALHSFTQDASAGTLQIYIQCATASAEVWIDDVRLYVNSAVIPLRTTTGIVASSYYKLESLTGQHQELVQVSSISAGVSVTLAALPAHQFAARDIFRSENYYPFLVVQKTGDPLVEEIPGQLATGAWKFLLRARQDLTGRY